MFKQISWMQKCAWVYAAGFLGIFIICHWPGLTNSQGYLLGLYRIDPVDDIFHLLSGLWGAVAAYASTRQSSIYFKIIGIPYGIDALVGLLWSTQFLNGDVFTKPLGHANFGMTNFLNNLPHIIILVVALFIGFVINKKLETSN